MDRLSAWFRWHWYWNVTRTWEALPRKIAWRLPRPVVMWCYVRVAANATTGQYADTIVPELGMMEALDRWPSGHG
jgi:hypothetical protein